MSLEIKFIYDSLEKDYSKEAISNFAKEFHNNFEEVIYNDRKYSCYIPNLFFDFFETKEFTKISKNFLEEKTHPNLQFLTILFRLSLELNSNKTNHEKEIMYSLVFNMLSKHTKEFNEAACYSIGFVASQGASIGVDISPSILVMNKLQVNHKEYFEEGFIDGMSSNFNHLLKNDKLFKLFSSKYDNWAQNSQNMLKKMYLDFIETSQQLQVFNPINAQSFFWMNNFFENESLKNYIKDYCNKAFQSKTEEQQLNTELEKKYFQLNQQLKTKMQEIQKFKSFISILSNHFNGLKDVCPLEESANRILSQILNNQTDYMNSLENYKIDNEKNKKLKEGIRKVL